MINSKALVAALGCLLFSGLTVAQRITETPQLTKDFQTRMKQSEGTDNFRIFNDSSLTGDRLAAMKFLYAYMSLPDMADYSPEFYLANVDASLKAMEEMSWGKDIPQREFLHFVLPVRVNNEALDSSRMVFYEELRDRVKNLSAKEAILETNHWCHEKVSYAPSDGRTSPPLSTLSQALGRCGEESTFTVAALRSIGIPARQVYSTRWAHTDDNHAWVEAFADGQWYFMGACEPEPVLDLGWFNEPASRGVLMKTDVIGNYYGDEEVLNREEIMTSINVTPKYAKTGTVNVNVVDASGNPVENARVYFCIYNYAEFFPAVMKTSDKEGKASLMTGQGDIVVWATDGDNFGFVKANSSDSTPVTLVMDKNKDYQGEFLISLTPAQPSALIPPVPEDMKAANNLRLAYEDSVRKSYISTFATPETAEKIAQKLKVDPSKLSKILTESRGNHAMIESLLGEVDPSLREDAVNLLLAVSEKDRRDIPAEVIIDNIVNTPDYPDSVLRVDYMLNPRVDTEALVPYKSFFKTNVPAELAEVFVSDPEQLVKWTKDNIEVTDRWNPKGHRMSPVAVWQQRVASPLSRDIFFVAMARSLGIPSRIDPVTRNTQYIGKDGKWKDARFEEKVDKAGGKGKIQIEYEPTGRIKDPLYYSQFSIIKLNDGMPVQLEFKENDMVSTINARNEDLDEGQYMILGGQRMADGSVLAEGNIFTLGSGESIKVPLVIPQDSTQVQVIGSLNAEKLYHDLALNEDKSLISTTGRGYYILGIVRPNHEPSSHTLNDISALKEEFEKWPGKIMVLFPSAEEASRFDSNLFPNLPSNMVLGTDVDGAINAELIESLDLPATSSPIFVIADTFNRVVFVSTGYTIGLGDRLLDILSRINLQTE